MIENGVLYIVGLQISISEFIWTIISFFPFMFLLKKFLYDPVLNFMDKRKAEIDESLEEGKTAQRALEENGEKLKAELTETGSAAREMVGAARSEADKAKSEVLNAAHAEAQSIHKNVQLRVDNEEAEARKSVEDNLPELVALLSQRLLHSDEAAENTELIENCVKAAEE